MAAYSNRVVFGRVFGRARLIGYLTKNEKPHFLIQQNELHSLCINHTRPCVLKLHANVARQHFWHKVAAVRLIHSETAPTSLSQTLATPYIPDPPPLPGATTVVDPPELVFWDTIKTLAEPSFANLSLTGWNPVGLLRSGMDVLHTPATLYVPDPPPLPVATAVVDPPELVFSDAIQTLAEPSFASLGLTGWNPVGLLRSGMEVLHVSLDLPWWGAIVIGTIIVKLCMFPLVIIAQRNAANMNNNLPQMQMLQLKMSEARRNGDALDSAKYGYELMTFMKEKQMNPLKNFVVPMCQAPVFISFFMCLRSMANLPVESMKEGGMMWFLNLTIPDPYYILPLITSATLFITLELGVDGGVRTGSLNMMRYFFRAMPILIFPFTISFPAAILCYWTTSNIVSLMQVVLLRYPPVREYFKIQKLIKHSAEVLPMQQKGMVANFRESMQNSKIAREIEERGRVDEIRFRKAGTGPLQKTYSFDPTKQNPHTGGPAAIAAKKQENRW